VCSPAQHERQAVIKTLVREGLDRRYVAAAARK